MEDRALALAHSSTLKTLIVARHPGGADACASERSAGIELDAGYGRQQHDQAQEGYVSEMWQVPIGHAQIWWAHFPPISMTLSFGVVLCGA